MNILVDTDVLLSVALRDRLPERVVRHVATNADCRWIVTAEILDEYFEVLKRPKFALPPAILRDWTELIEMRTLTVPSPPTSVNFPRDPKDAIFLSAAVATNADFLITGDNDLLTCGLAALTQIVSTADFASLYHIS